MLVNFKYWADFLMYDSSTVFNGVTRVFPVFTDVLSQVFTQHGAKRHFSGKTFNAAHDGAEATASVRSLLMSFPIGIVLIHI